jgi:hypothetical protein
MTAALAPVALLRALPTPATADQPSQQEPTSATTSNTRSGNARSHRRHPIEVPLAYPAVATARLQSAETPAQQGLRKRP